MSCVFVSELLPSRIFRCLLQCSRATQAVTWVAGPRSYLSVGLCCVSLAISHRSHSHLLQRLSVPVPKSHNSCESGGAVIYTCWSQGLSYSGGLSGKGCELSRGLSSRDCLAEGQRSCESDPAFGVSAPGFTCNFQMKLPVKQTYLCFVFSEFTCILKYSSAGTRHWFHSQNLTLTESIFLL